MPRQLRSRSAALLVGTAMTAGAALAQEGEITLPEVEVVGTAPLAAGAEQSRVPANTYVLRREDLTLTGPPSAVRALNERVGGVTLNEAQGNPFQPNLT